MKIHQVTTTEDIAECLRLRAEVFIQEQNVPEAEECDGLDDQCLHFLAYRDGQSIGAARLNYLTDAYAKIQRVCVVKSARRTGAGAMIVQAVIDYVKKGGRHSLIRLGAQTYALAFYERLGFTVYGDEFMDAGIPHYNMELKL